ncbi:MAG: cytochrome c3 family protein [Tepidisphaeraceae bacterium]|jgi:predicted CXXCH cytochrome family protein
MPFSRDPKGSAFIGCSRIAAAYLALSITLLYAPSAQAQIGPTSIVNSPHNLSASGPGKIKATSEQEVCIFCHTPHNAAPVQPLWNRDLPVNAYKVYSSSSLVSTPGQPTGSSKLCLSCHDGTIALGTVLSSNLPLTMANGVITLPPGATNLGTDLSGDHPISFTYDSNLAVKNGNLVDPGALPTQVKLESGQLQCASCHNPHDDSLGNFLVMSNTNSQLCNSCHLLSGEATVTGHNQCIDCHQEHNAPSGALLLTQATVTATCAVCHGNSIPTASASAATLTPGATLVYGGSMIDGPDPSLPSLARAGVNVTADLNKMSRHNADVPSALGNLMPKTAIQGPTDLVNCADCHEPHSIKSGIAMPPNIAPALGKASGVTIAGAITVRAKYEYEVCFKCHGTENSDRPFLTRKAVQTNIRLEFAPTAVSFHPVTSPGRGRDVPSLNPGLTTASVIYCTDCHNSDTGRKSGGAGPDGPHGSNIPPLLIANYDTIDGASESSVAYALCYRCHQRASILNNESFSLHRSHIVNDRTPCSACHDAHGISSAQGTFTDNAHLINFDTTIVFPDPITKRLEYRTFGPRSGQCTLLCHGKDHSGLNYP